MLPARMKSAALGRPVRTIRIALQRTSFADFTGAYDLCQYRRGLKSARVLIQEESWNAVWAHRSIWILHAGKLRPVQRRYCVLPISRYALAASWHLKMCPSMSCRDRLL